MANLASTLWIPAFAGMTAEGICRSLFSLSFGLHTHVSPLWDCMGKFRFCRSGEPSPPSETKRKSRPANPLSLYGRGRGRGVARKRGFAGGTPALLSLDFGLRPLPNRARLGSGLVRRYLSITTVAGLLKLLPQ